MDAVVVGADAFFTARRIQLALLAALHRLPVVYPIRLFAEAGGLISYGTSLADAFRQAGVYTGRILKRCEACGPAGGTGDQVRARDQSEDRQGCSASKVPPSLLARADEVIE